MVQLTDPARFIKTKTLHFIDLAMSSISRLRHQVLQPDDAVEARSQEAHGGQGLRVSAVRSRGHRYPDPHEGELE